MKSKFTYYLKLVAIVFTVGGTFPTTISAKVIRPISKHVKDALVINNHRAPLYAKLSDNKSLALSNELMTMETLALLWLTHLDYKAEPYIKAGVGVFEDDLIDMKETPVFMPNFEDNNAPIERISFPVKELSKAWSQKLKDDNLQSIYSEAVTLLKEGALHASNQNCLTKHFVESIARSIKNHEGHRETSRTLGLEDPKNLLLSFLTIQIKSLSWAQSLDRRAFEIQKNNVPLFCRDVPFIPFE